MSLSVTSRVRVNGPNCNHFEVTINHEGTSRTFQVSQAEIDQEAPNLVEAIKTLVMIWIKYRARLGRTIDGVTIA